MIFFLLSVGVIDKDAGALPRQGEAAGIRFIS